MKHAKKSMFITTVLMVAVLIVAVSTATFAWYTANNTATANEVGLTSASSTSANIAIGWDANSTSSTITLGTPDATTFFNPTIPEAKLVKDTTTFATTKFQTAGIDSLGKFTAAGTTGNAWTAKEGTVAKDFYVINHNATSGATVTLDCAITGTLAAKLCVAVYVNGNLAGLYTNGLTGGYTYGTIAKDALASGLSKDTTIFDKVTFDLTAKIPEQDDHYAVINFYAWLDGAATVDADANQDVAFAFTFNATPKAAA